MLSDPIADFCTRIRNAYLSKKKYVPMPYSKMKASLAKILEEEGYLKSSKVNPLTGGSKFKTLEVELVYDEEGQPVLTEIKRISKPGLRTYSKSKELTRILSGYGLSIVSTSKGLMTNKQARDKNLGGEVICQLW